MAKQRDLIESWSNLKTTLDMCKRAWDKEKVKDYKRLLESLDIYWKSFNAAYELYKEDTISKAGKDEIFFNAVTIDANEVEVPNYAYNDKWKTAEFERFADTRELLQDKLDEISSVATSSALQNVEQNTVVPSSNTIEQAVLDIKTEIKSLENAVTSLETEVLSYNDGEMPTTVASEHKINIGRILDLINKDFKSVVYAKLEINGESADREFSDEKIRVMYSLLSIKWKDKLNNLYILIAKKTKPSIELDDSKITVPAAD